jgi:hypothetical protein
MRTTNQRAGRRKGDTQPPELAALKRAAKEAIELARRTGTSAWVMVNGQIVDATKLRTKPAKRSGRAKPRARA